MAATDRRMLEALCASDRLTDYERDVFVGMLGLICRTSKPLTRPQHEWVEGRYLAYDLDADEPAENLVSTGKVARSTVVFPYENLPRPAKPPGRK